MPWYTYTDENTVDFSQPVCAEGATGTVYLLLPTNYDNSVAFRGYDWFNPLTGKWNSSANHKTVEAAIVGYKNVRNCTISLG